MGEAPPADREDAKGETMELKQLIRRTIEIDYEHQHRHASSSLSALPIIADIFSQMNHADDVFILSKGHAAPAYYAVLEAWGYHPDTSYPHPYRDPANGIPVTTGSLGHGLPLAVGFALGKAMQGQRGTVFVLLGDGETLEGTTWEALHLADHFDLGNLHVYVDRNGWQGSRKCLVDTLPALMPVFPVWAVETKRGQGVRLFEDHQDWHTHTITCAEFAQIMEELT